MDSLGWERPFGTFQHRLQCLGFGGASDQKEHLPGGVDPPARVTANCPRAAMASAAKIQ